MQILINKNLQGSYLFGAPWKYRTDQASNVFFLILKKQIYIPKMKNVG